MADNLNSGNVLTTQVGNNVVIIDPNKVVDSAGKVTDRLVPSDELVMYANLNARIFPRSKVLAGTSQGASVQVELFEGEINFMRPEGKSKLDSDWTEAFTDPEVNKQVNDVSSAGVTVSSDIQNKNDFQGFGITSINVKINASYIPQVTINFTDIRGKTLFEQAKGNTPYTAFFHLPYPTFFLTLKGYYGKAVQYQLTLEKFVSRFDPSNGDYLVTCDFKGNHIALLRDINMHEAVTAPYMFPNRMNASTGEITSTRGRQTMLDVYRQYKDKGLIGNGENDTQDFPELTIVELIEIVQNLDNNLSTLYGEANLEATTDKLEYSETLNLFKEAVTGKDGWVKKYLDIGTQRNLKVVVPSDDPSAFSGKTIITPAFPLLGMSQMSEEKDYQKQKDGKENIEKEAKKALELIVGKYTKLLKDNPTFGPISQKFDGKYRVNSGFSEKNYNLYDNSIIRGNVTIADITTKLNKEFAPWFAFAGKSESFNQVWDRTSRVFEKKAELMAEDMTEKLNERLEEELGFRPTIRNVFAVIMAGADTFLRMLDDVHNKAMLQSNNEKRINTAKQSNDTPKGTSLKSNGDETPKLGNVFPWPQYYVTEEKDCKTSSTLKYPGDKEVIETTQAWNTEVWPEVEFVEEYTKSSTYKFSTFSSPTNNDGLDMNFTPTSIFDWPPYTTPYKVLSNVNIWWEIIQRAEQIIFYGSFMTRFRGSGQWVESLIELSEYEANNLFEKIKDQKTIKQIFMDMPQSALLWMENILARDDYPRFVPYLLYNSVIPIPFNSTGKFIWDPQNFTVISKEFTKNFEALKITKGNGFFDVAPTVSGNWVQTNFAGGSSLNTSNLYDISKNLTYDIITTNVLSDTTNTKYFTEFKYAFAGKEAKNYYLNYLSRTINYSELKNSSGVDKFYQRISENKFVTEGEILFTPESIGAPGVAWTDPNPIKRLTSILNTPYFINALLDGVQNEKSLGPNSTNPYTKASYLFLNSLPLPTFREKAISVGADESSSEFGNYISQMFNQLPALHEVPVALLLRVGSVWWRYKNMVRSTTGNVDPLSSIWGNVGQFGTIAPYNIGPAYIYDEVNQVLDPTVALQPPYAFKDMGVTYQYSSEQNVNNIMQVGVYPALVGALHFIATDSTSYINTGSGANLNDIISPSAPLTITNNTGIGFTSPGGTQVQFYDVYMDSATIINKNVGVQYNNSEEPKQYYILYPSSGGLGETDANTYNTPVMNNTAIHNGATRLLWGTSNYGYFEHKAGYKGTPNQYIKKVNPNKTQQTSWEFKDDGNYSTIEELRGVFNVEQLNEFEQMFLKFATPTGSYEIGGSLKTIIKELVVVEKTWLDAVEIVSDMFSKNLAWAQLEKFNTAMDLFLNKTVKYEHETTSNLNLISGDSNLIQKVSALHNEIQPGFLGSPFAEFSDSYDFGNYSDNPIIPASGIPWGGGNPIELQEARIHLGEFVVQDSTQFSSLEPFDDTNPMYKFFMDVRGNDGGIEFNVENIQSFAPIARLYGTYLTTNPTFITPKTYLDLVMNEINSLKSGQELFINSLIKNLKKLIKEDPTKDTNSSEIIENDERASIDAPDVKLELYNQFKTLNDRWIAGINLSSTGTTLFEKFLFFDRANSDIGDEAIINIWDVLKLDSPFKGGEEDTIIKSTLTQSVASYLSTILANNYFNFIPLPAYINFNSPLNDGSNTQLQGNAMFGNFMTVDYLDARPAFLCQYVGKPSSQLNIENNNNGYNNDTFDPGNIANNAFIRKPCKDNKPELSNKMMGFTVDFGIKNQNIFESITLDQSQFQNTSESFKILQEMADSGGGGSTSMASISLYNIYASRSYTAKVTCVGNVTIQPTQYFQLRYLPMFNGPYLIINVDHEIRANSIETSFEGVRVPLPELPLVQDLVQRVNKKLYEKGEDRLKELPVDLYFDARSATESQMKLKSNQNGYIDNVSTYQTFASDNVSWKNILDGDKFSVIDMFEDPEKTHLGIDFVPLEGDTTTADGVGLPVYSATEGKIEKMIDGCNHLQTTNNCGKYGNMVEIKLTVNINPDEGDTKYYITRYGFMRSELLVKNQTNLNISDAGFGNKKLGLVGNSGLSKETHLHFEIVRGLKGKNNKIIEHYLNPKNFLPMFNA